MPRRSKVITVLPPHIRKEVERRMLAKRFSDYEGLAEWVRQQGYDISDDSLWRYGKALKQEFTSVRFSLFQARLLADQAPDRKGQLMQAMLQAVQQRLLWAIAEAEKSDSGQLFRLVHAVTELARVSLLQQRWAAELRREKQQRRQKEEEEMIAEDLRELAYDDLDDDASAEESGSDDGLPRGGKPE